MMIKRNIVWRWTANSILLLLYAQCARKLMMRWFNIIEIDFEWNVGINIKILGTTGAVTGPVGWTKENKKIYQKKNRTTK